MTASPADTPRPHQRPFTNSYGVPGAALYAGEYPGAPTANAARAKLTQLLDAGITAVIDLTTPADRLTPYADMLQVMAAERNVQVAHDSHPIPDNGVCSDEEMHALLNAIDHHLQHGAVVYVHCWGGVGRTGTVVGCWLIRRKHDTTTALRMVNELFSTMSPEKVQRHAATGSPQTETQRLMVGYWGLEELEAGEWFGDMIPRMSAIYEWGQIGLPPGATREDRDRMRGALVGLAVGDAVGTTVEFCSPGSFPPVTDMTGGGPFHLPAGAWTDDTSMALCLAESLLIRNSFDPRDQIMRYVRWWRTGHLSSTDRCFDIGNTVRESLTRFEQTVEPNAGSMHPMAAGNGSLMRLAPVPVFFAREPETAIAMAGDSSRTTHGTLVAVDACRYFAALLVGAMRGASKWELLSPRYTPVPGYWDEHPLHPTIAAIADGSFKEKMPPAIRGTGYVAEALEAALWAFHQSDDFRAGCLLAVNLGNDADTTAAIFGQLGGAFYGESGIPAEWCAKLARKPVIDEMAESLFHHAFQRVPLVASRASRAKAEAAESVAEADGDACKALRSFLEEEEAAKREMGIMSFMGGPMHAQASRDYMVMHLRVAATLQLIRLGYDLR